MQGADWRKRVNVKNPFWIDVSTVTNKQFAAFVAATGYHTEAELYGWSFVLDSLATEDMRNAVDSKVPHSESPSEPHEGFGTLDGSRWCILGTPLRPRQLDPQPSD
jgi:formylglycine-generating enzyme required for sulfatase activity